MTNEDILRIAMQQSAADLDCKSEDFLKKENIIAIKRKIIRRENILTFRLIVILFHMVIILLPPYEKI